MKCLFVKRIFALSLAISITVSVSGCGNNKVETTSENVQTTEVESDVTESHVVMETEENTDVQSELVMEEETDERSSQSEKATEITDDLEDVEATLEEENDLTSTQRNSINMLNYITVLTQQINASKESRIFLETVQSSLINDVYPNAVDTKTQTQINNLWKTIDEYRMIDVKRERLDYIYEQNKAQALRQAIPNPLGLLSTVQSGNLLKTAASVLYMAVDSVTSYQAASTQADLKYLQDNWELEDAEMQELSNSQLNLLNYMLNMVRDNGFPGEWALNEEAVINFVDWSNEDNLASRIEWLESHEQTYREFRTYWLEMAKSYYQDEQYEKCLNAIQSYEKVATRIFRKDYDYAEVLPMVILSAKEVMETEEYVEIADRYAGIIMDNCAEDDWALSYFAAQIYIDLYANTENELYLNTAYDIALDNVNYLKREQESLNNAYIADIKEIKVEKGDSKNKKEEIKNYNKLLKEKRKVELPPVSEAFYLNCDLLVALVDELNKDENERKRIDAILHDGDKQIFLTEALDNRFWLNAQKDGVVGENIEIEFDGEKLVIPAVCITDRYYIEVSIAGGETLNDWIVEEVERPKNAECSDFLVTLTSKQGKEYDYSVGDKITISVLPVVDNSEDVINFTYEVVEKKTLNVIKGKNFERIPK